jgi:hypothetical protein
MGRRTMAMLAGVGVAGIFFTGGCASREAICSSGEYPIAAVRAAGRACVEEGRPPDPGWVRFPEGKVPEHVGDEWDRYWQEHLLDENGSEIERRTSS